MLGPSYLKMLFYIVLKHYLPTVLCVSSCFCIIPSIYVFCRTGLCRPIAAYLITLAFVDLLTGFLLVFLSLDHFLLRFICSDSAQSTYSLVEDLCGELVDILLLISNWLTVAVAVERYLAICFPLYVRCLSQSVRKRIISCIILTAIILQFPSLAKYWPVVQHFWSPLSSFNLWFTRVLVLLVFPCTILVYVNTRLIQAIRSSFILKHGNLAPTSLDISSNDDCTSVCNCNISKSTRLTVAFTLNGPLARERGLHALREEKSITINLVCLIVVFFLCQVPFILLSVAFKLYEAGLESTAFRSVNLTTPRKSNFLKEDSFDQTSPLLTNASITFAITDSKLDILAYIRALSVIFLMLKGDLYFLFYCWLCNNFFRALRSFLHL